MAKKLKAPARSSDELRAIILKYFYERNQKATSMRGTKGASAKISTIRAELKARDGLTQQDVLSISNVLT